MSLLLGFLIPLFGFAAGGYLLYKGSKGYLTLHDIWNTPTSKAGSAAIGLVEVFGKAESPAPVKSHVTKTPCAYSRAEGEYYDRMRGRWKRFFVLEKGSIFQIKDKSGTIQVDPSGATLNFEAPHYKGFVIRGTGSDITAPLFGSMKGTIHFFETMFDFICPTGESGPGHLPESSDKEAARFLSESKELGWVPNGKMRITEYIVPPGSNLYVLGDAKVKNETLVIGKGTYYDTVLIADSEERLVDIRLRTKIAISLIAGAILTMLSVIVTGIIIGALW